MFLFVFFHVFFVFLTTFGPHHYWPKPPLGPLYQIVLCPNLCETILDPKKPWPVGLLFGTICCSCLVFWAMDFPARDPPCPRPPCVLCRCCGVVWCVGAVFVQIFRVRQKFGRSPDSPPPDPSPDSTPSAGPPSVGPPSAGPPKISRFFFSFSHTHFHSFFFLSLSLGVSSRVFFSLSLGVFSWNFGGVLVGSDLKCACFRPQVVL